MSLLSSPPSFLLRPKTPSLHPHRFLTSFSPSSLPLSFCRYSSRIFSSIADEWGEKPGSNSNYESESESESSFTKFTAPDPSFGDDEDEWGPDNKNNESPEFPSSIPDEWGEKSGPDPELGSSYTSFTGPDPPIREDEDEWGPESRTGSDYKVDIEGEAGIETGKNWELKKCLIDTVFGSGFGFRASAELRAEASELVSQLEAVNPTDNPIEKADLLDGNWFLVYTAASELLPLLALLSTLLLKVEQISQAIDTANRIVENSVMLASPFANCLFSASAEFEVRTPSRIQVQLKEATFKPPDIRFHTEVPESVDVFGQRIPLSPVQQLLKPLQEAAVSISRTLYGLPPLKIPLPGKPTESWLLITYLDEDLRISRVDDGGLFVLVREGSPLLEKWRHSWPSL